MIRKFEGQTADDIWKSAYKAVSTSSEQTSRAGTTKEILHVAFSIENPVQRWITSRSPVINPAFAIAEVIWIVNGRNDLKFLHHWNKNYSDYVGNSPRVHGAYGFRLAKHFGFNQMERAYHALQNTPNSRQVLLQIWDPKIDLPLHTGAARNRDIPCNLASLLKVRNSRLEWMQILRSNDLFRGLPYNIVQFTTLQEILAGWLKIKVGTFNQLSDSLHLYLKDVKTVKIAHHPRKPNNDSLALPFRESIKVFKGMEKLCCEIMTTKDSGIESLLGSKQLPTAYHNLLLVLGAEHSRRNKLNDLAQHFIEKCSNPALRHIWKTWYLSKQDNKHRIPRHKDI